MSEPLPGYPSEPSPEKPSGGFKVEILQPEILYQLVKDKISGQGKNVDVSHTDIGDIFLYEHTELSNFGPEMIGGYVNPRTQNTFYFSTNLWLSASRINSQDHGYYSDEKVSRIQEELIKFGLDAKAHKLPWNGYNVIRVMRNGYFVEISMGFNSRETDEALRRKDIEGTRRQQADDRNTKPDQELFIRQERSIQRRLDEIKRGLTHHLLNLHLISEDRAKDDGEGYPKFKDQEDFIKAAQTYAEIYEKFIKALYTEDGKQPPNKTVILRPPVLDQDTVTEIKSIETTQPTPMVPEQIKTEIPSFDEIAGQEEAVKEAKRLVLAINHPEVYERRGIKRPKGILFYGPPGTGKTLLAKAIAKEAEAQFFEVSSADIGTKWYGESERLMQEVFNRANRVVTAGGKVIIFFDELDALAPPRAEAHEATRKVVSILLQNMDGMKANPNVTIIAATNRPAGIDEALRRPGRFDKLIAVPIPDESGRAAILKVHIEKARRAATAAGELFANDLDLEKVALSTAGMVGADLANLINLTLEEKVTAELEGKVWLPVTSEDLITMASKLGYQKEEKRRIGFIPLSSTSGK